MRRLLVLTLVLSAVLASVAPAKTKNAITPKNPKQGEVLAAGHGLTYKGRVTGPGHMYVYVSKSRKQGKNGILKKFVDVIRAKRKGTHFTAKAERETFSSYYLNTPGTYYWQAHRIACVDGANDCSAEGPTVKFKVR